MDTFQQKALLLALGCALLMPFNAWADSTGLEANNSHYVHLCINVEGKIGGDPLDKADVQTKVEFLLRSAGVEFKVIPWHDFEETLQVIVQTGPTNSFYVSVRFWRAVEYNVKGKKHMVYAPVYLEGAFGTHGDNRYYIINSVGEQVEKFLNKYLRVNGPSQRKQSSKGARQ